MDNISKRTWAEINIAAITYNYYKMRERIPADCKFMGVVKANAYGHGSVAVAKALEADGCDYLGVACLEEAEELRRAGNSLPILILGYTPPEFITRVVACNATQALGSLAAAEQYSQVLVTACLNLKVHIKLETGMGRTGFDVKTGEVSSVVSALALPGFEPEGIFTHFACSDDPSKSQHTLGQFGCFLASVEKIEAAAKVRFQIRHCANSGALINYPQMALDMVRPGLLLYGIYPEAERGGLEIAPAMELKTRIYEVFDLAAGESVSYGSTFTAERNLRVAVLGLGYADGLPRVLSGKMDVIIDDTLCPQIGRICMDMCMVDVTKLANPRPGQVAMIFGQDKTALLPVTTQAEKAGTISYELLCAVSPRVSRLYLE